MTDLSRERLAELRQLAESVHHPFRWYAAHDLMRGHAMADEDAHLIAAMDPKTALALIAQAERALSASNAALADALGLLREWADTDEKSILMDLTRSLLAKHGPSP